MSFHEFVCSRSKKLEDPLPFFIKSNDPAHNELKILCQAETKESKNKWLGILKWQLQTQMDMHLATVAINDLLCMKNAGAQIAMDFS